MDKSGHVLFLSFSFFFDFLGYGWARGFFFFPQLCRFFFGLTRHGFFFSFWDKIFFFLINWVIAFFFFWLFVTFLF